MVADFERSDAFADGLDDAAAFMAQDGREDTFGVIARQGEGVGVADAGGDDAHQHFALFRRLDVHFDDLQRFIGGEGHGGAGFDGHGRVSLKKVCAVGARRCAVLQD